LVIGIGFGVLVRIIKIEVFIQPFPYLFQCVINTVTTAFYVFVQVSVSLSQGTSSLSRSS
jgi:hypothetical protein